MQAVILAGGLGRRLRPLTEEIPKSMVPVSGRPYLEYQIRWLRKNNINVVLLLTGYLGEKIESYFGDGSSFGTKITYSQEPEALGTGGALKLAEDKLEPCFSLIYGDSFLPLNFSDLIKHFLATDKKGIVTICNNHFHNTGVDSNIQSSSDGFILKYKKNSKDPDLNFIDAGIMVFKKEITNLIPQGKNMSLEEEIFPALIEKKELAAHISKQPFYDIGTKERLENFEELIRVNTFNF